MKVTNVNQEYRSKLNKEASEAQREATKKVKAAHDKIQKAEIETDQALDRIQNEYQIRRQKMVENQKQDLANEDVKGYERSQNLRHEQEEMLNKATKKGEHELEELKDYYAQLLYLTDKSNRDKYTELVDKFQQKSTVAQAQQQFERDTIQQTQAARIKQLAEDHQESIERLSKQNQAEYRRLMENYQNTSRSNLEKFQDKFIQQENNYNGRLNTMNTNTSDVIDALRDKYSTKLAAFSQRQQDPFYQIVKMNASIEETDDSFIVKAKIPSHERENVQLNVYEDEVVISGNRRSQEKLEFGPKQVQSTSSFQTFSESFPIEWPVDKNLVSKQFDNDTVIFKIPKKSYKREKPQKVQPEQIRAARPRFPNDLPIEELKMKESKSTYAQNQKRGSFAKKTLE